MVSGVRINGAFFGGQVTLGRHVEIGKKSMFSDLYEIMTTET